MARATHAAQIDLRFGDSARELSHFGTLEMFLRQNLEYGAYSDAFADWLTELLQENLSEDQAKDAQKLAHQ